MVFCVDSICSPKVFRVYAQSIFLCHLSTFLNKREVLLIILQVCSDWGESRLLSLLPMRVSIVFLTRFLGICPKIVGELRNAKRCIHNFVQM